MKNIIWILLLVVSVSFAQNNRKHKNKHKHNNKHHNHYVQKQNNDWFSYWFGIALFDIITDGNGTYHNYGWSDNTVMEMHFRYIPRRDEWVLQRKRRHVSASYFLNYGKPRIVATFDYPGHNTNSYHDYSIIVHRDGYWEYDCPASLRKYFTKKVKNNIKWR